MTPAAAPDASLAQGALARDPGTRRALVDAASLGRILVRLPNWLGDVCMAAPAIAALAAAAPQARFVIACRPSVASIAGRLPAVEDVIALDAERGLRAASRIAKTYRAARCDAAILCPRSFSSALPVALARVPIRIGFASDVRSLLLTHPIRGWKALRLPHRRAYFGRLIEPFGLGVPTAPWGFSPGEPDLAWADAWLAAAPGRRAGLPVVAFEPGGAYGVAKRWPADRYAALAGRLVREGRADVVLVGTKDMADLHARIAEGAAAGPAVISAAGATNLPQLAGLLARCRLLVTNDTGPMHLAAAVGTPVLALFGSTDPAGCSPMGRAPSKVLYDRVECSPCDLKVCPVPGHPCLDQFEVDRVFAEALALLGAGPG